MDLGSEVDLRTVQVANKLGPADWLGRLAAGELSLDGSGLEALKRLTMTG